MVHEALQGWNISVAKTTIGVQNPDGPPGEFMPGEGWEFMFTEVAPPSGNTIRFAFGKEVRDMVIRELTGGIVLHGGDLPKL